MNTNPSDRPAEQASPSLLVIVPNTESEACRRLQQTLDGAGVRVVLDRRHQSEQRARDRRTRSAGDAALAAGKWIIVPADAEQLDVLDADARAILFLYCNQHWVPCQPCQETYRLGWLVRTEGALSCPRCSADLTPIVVAHALRCPNWVQRRTRGNKPPARLDAHQPRAEATAS